MKNLIVFATMSFALVLMLDGCRFSHDDTALFTLDPDTPRAKVLFDKQWTFFRGQVEGAENAAFDDATWRTLDLPHDWSIEDIPGTESPIDSGAIGGINTGYFVGGTGWYRKRFKLPDNTGNMKFSIEFEGVYMDTDIWLNGQHLGNHPYGYTSFWYDISDELLPGQENVLAIRVRNEGRNSRWYSGSGIYRHVWLHVTGPVHIAQWGTAITTPESGLEEAKVQISNTIVNESDQKSEFEVVTMVIDHEGKEAAVDYQTITAEPGSEVLLNQELKIENPRLWGPDSPALYRAVTEIRDDHSTLLDRVENNFGIRSIEFSVDGFFLNGQNLVLKGGCVHHDNGPLGAAAFDRAEERKVELMKTSGFNSIRCAHNPPSPAFLDACDRLGILVIDEAFDMWKRGKNPMDYHRFFDAWWEVDVASMVKRDRNHASILMWSTGNEIPERATPDGVATAAMLADYVRALDPSRPVTSAVNGLGPDKDPYFATLDVAGYNYAFGGDHGMESIFRQDHRRVPDRIMYCSESYPLEAFGAWMDVLDNPCVIGDFVWTGFDYLGEASIGWLGYPHEGSFYPWNHAYCGDLDICGMKRPQSYYRDVLWNSGRQLSMFVQPPEPSFKENPDQKDWSKWHWHDVVARWNWEGHEGIPLNVEVYCGHDLVELFLNGKSLGKKETNRATAWIAGWEVPYQPGTLKAIAYEGSVVVEESELVTAGHPEMIHLTADRTVIRADGQDLSYITVELVDGKGRKNTISDNLVQFEIEGPGTILAVASSDPMSPESYKLPRRHAYQGRCMVVIKATEQPGNILLKASSAGLDDGTITIIAD